MVKLVRPKPRTSPSPRTRNEPTDTLKELFTGPTTSTFPEFAIPRRTPQSLEITPKDIQKVKSRQTVTTTPKSYDRTKYLTYPSPWGGHKDKPKRPTPTVPKDKPKEDEPRRPFPPVEIPDDIGDLPFPFPFPEVPPPSDVPTEPDEWTEDESVPDWRETRPPDPQVPLLPTCSDDPLEQELYNIPPCYKSGDAQISFQTPKLRTYGKTSSSYYSSRFRNHSRKKNPTGRTKRTRYFRSSVRQSSQRRPGRVRRNYGRGSRKRWFYSRRRSPIF